MTTADEVLAFWLDEKGPENWFSGGEALDAEIRKKFGETLQRAAEGGLSLWLTYPSGTLAYVIVTDQFSRNIHRGSTRAFATDNAARAAAKMAIKREWDLKIDEPARLFFYWPLVHSENLCDQDRAVRLVKSRLSNSGQGFLDHARAHREVIRRFGRFPFRNEALDRPNRKQEDEFMENGGYGAVVRELQSEVA